MEKSGLKTDTVSERCGATKDIAEVADVEAFGALAALL